MQGRMKAVIKTEAGPGAELQMVDIPRIGDEDVLVKVQAVALCGTDRAIYKWNAWAQSRIQTPLILGHEMAGTIVEVGRAVTNLKPGDLVSVGTVCSVCTTSIMSAATCASSVLIRRASSPNTSPSLPIMPGRMTPPCRRRWQLSRSRWATASIPPSPATL